MQIELRTIIADAEKAYYLAVSQYAEKNRERYLGFASFITPGLSREETYRRFVFSVLSVQSRFDLGCTAFSRIVALSEKERRNARKVKKAIQGLLYTETKIKGCLEVERITREDLASLHKRETESWDMYRRRVQGLVHGLGKAKASFACCLMYPLHADIACLDTWMLKQWGLENKNGRLSWKDYLAGEEAIRQHARKWKVSTFVAQWLIWDHVRGTVESHEVLGMPGTHKDSVR